jgi:hypothetical protein
MPTKTDFSNTSSKQKFIHSACVIQLLSVPHFLLNTPTHGPYIKGKDWVAKLEQCDPVRPGHKYWENMDSFPYICQSIGLCITNWIISLDNFLKVIYSYVHALFGPFLPTAPSLSPPPPLASRQNLFCPFLQFCWREDTSNNKKDKAFLLVEIRIATYCFHAQVCYNPNWFISTWPFHWSSVYTYCVRKSHMDLKPALV